MTLDQETARGGGNADMLRQGIDGVVAEVGDPEVGALAQLLDPPADDGHLPAHQVAHVGIGQGRHDVLGPGGLLDDLEHG